MGFFSKLSGLDALAQKYPAAAQVPNAAVSRQTVQIGRVRYRNCVSIFFSEAFFGLRVEHPPVGTATDLQIPWREIKAVQAAKLYGRSAKRLSVGCPEVGAVTVYDQLFERMRPYLAPAMPDAL